MGYDGTAEHMGQSGYSEEKKESHTGHIFVLLGCLQLRHAMQQHVRNDGPYAMPPTARAKNATPPTTDQTIFSVKYPSLVLTLFSSVFFRDVGDAEDLGEGKGSSNDSEAVEV